MRLVRSVLIPAVAVLALAVGAVGWWQYADRLSSPALDNTALLDAAGTAGVQAEVSRSLEQVLSYTYQDPGTTKAAARELLSGAAKREYDRLFADLQKQAPGQKLVLTAQVNAVGVEELTEDRARLLVFVDQSSRRAKDARANVSAAQLSVAARKASSGQWVITALEVL